MDYEEKYNKLVDAIKVLQETNPSDEGIQNWVNDNVPELNESEDERIRKRLIAMCQHYIECYAFDQYNLEGYKEALAWLEKQGQSHWNEEDEIGFDDTLWAIQQATTIAKDENDMGNLWYAERWLKLLKQRIGG